MNREKWKIKKPADVLGIAVMLFMAYMLAKCTVGEVSLLTNFSYTIGRVFDIYRTGKMEMRVRYYYLVDGKRYISDAEWNRRSRLGDRYIVRYGKLAPYGNDFLHNRPVPDSIEQDTGRIWRDFLRSQNLR